MANVAPHIEIDKILVRVGFHWGGAVYPCWLCDRSIDVSDGDIHPHVEKLNGACLGSQPLCWSCFAPLAEEGKVVMEHTLRDRDLAYDIKEHTDVKADERPRVIAALQALAARQRPYRVIIDVLAETPSQALEFSGERVQVLDVETGEVVLENSYSDF